LWLHNGQLRRDNAALRPDNESLAAPNRSLWEYNGSLAADIESSPMDNGALWQRNDGDEMDAGMVFCIFGCFKNWLLRGEKPLNTLISFVNNVRVTF
jgi:hypothetical protein